MIDLSLTPEQQLLKQTARDFALNEVQPIVEKIESNNSHVQPWDLCKNFFFKGVDLGFTQLLLPAEYGSKGGKNEIALYYQPLVDRRFLGK
jgi:alkylation response protein AidB-like acyl-CoA dehydrogenase